MATTVLGTLLLFAIGFVTRSVAQEPATNYGDALTGLHAFLPVISNPEWFGGLPPVLPDPATGTTIVANQAVLGELPFDDTSDYTEGKHTACDMQLRENFSHASQQRSQAVE